MSEAVYFIAKGKSLEIASGWLDERDRVRSEWFTHARSHGGEKAVPFGSSSHYVGIATPNGCDGRGWRPSKKYKARETIFEPNPKTPEGRLLKKEIAAMVRPDGDALAHPMGLPRRIEYSEEAKSMVMPNMAAQRLGDTVILIVPASAVADGYSPPDAERIKESHYHLLLEECQEREAAAKAG